MVVIRHPMYSHGTSNVGVPAHSSQDPLTSSPSPGRVPLISLYARSGKVALAPEQYFLEALVGIEAILVMI